MSEGIVKVIIKLYQKGYHVSTLSADQIILFVSEKRESKDIITQINIRNHASKISMGQTPNFVEIPYFKCLFKYIDELPNLRKERKRNCR